MKTKIEAKIKDLFSEDIATILIDHLQACVRFELSPGSIEGIGKSKIGGQPDFPVDRAYTEAGNLQTQLFTQINLSELAAVFPDSPYNKEGMLYIFGAFYERSLEGVFPALPATKAGLFGYLTEQELVLGRRSKEPGSLEIPEQAMTLHPYFCTLSKWDHRLGEHDLDLEKVNLLDEAIAEICGFELPSSNLLFAHPQQMPDHIAMSWAAFDLALWDQINQPGIREKLTAEKVNYTSLLQMELVPKLFNTFSEETWSSHFNLALHKSNIEEKKMTNVTYAQYAAN